MNVVAWGNVRDGQLQRVWLNESEANHWGSKTVLGPCKVGLIREDDPALAELKRKAAAYDERLVLVEARAETPKLSLGDLLRQQLGLPVGDEKWKQHAAAGELIPAIKELRSLTGLGLKQAKDHVEASEEYKEFLRNNPRRW